MPTVELRFVQKILDADLPGQRGLERGNKCRDLLCQLIEKEQLSAIEKPTEHEMYITTMIPYDDQDFKDCIAVVNIAICPMFDTDVEQLSYAYKFWFKNCCDKAPPKPSTGRIQDFLDVIPNVIVESSWIFVERFVWPKLV